MATCSNCGSQVNDSAKFCENCGTPINAPSVSSSAPTEKLDEVVVEEAASYTPASAENASAAETVPLYTEATEAAEVGQTAEMPPQYAPPVQGQQYAAAPPNASQPAYAASAPQDPQQKNSKAIVALVLGILAIVFSGSVAIGLVLGIIAIVIGSSALKISIDGKAKAGRICGIIGVALSVIALISYIVLGVIVGAAMNSDLGGYTASDIIEEAIENNGDVDVDEIIESITSSSSAASSSPDQSSATDDAAPDASAVSTEADKFVGLWVGTDESGDSMTLDIAQDGTCYVLIDGEVESNGNYEIVDDYLVIHGHHKADYEFQYKFKNGNLLLTYPGTDVTLVFERIA